jgi:hypothetical protein
MKPDPVLIHHTIPYHYLVNPVVAHMDRSAATTLFTCTKGVTRRRRRPWTTMLWLRPVSSVSYHSHLSVAVVPLHTTWLAHLTGMEARHPCVVTQHTSLAATWLARRSGPPARLPGGDVMRHFSPDSVTFLAMDSCNADVEWSAPSFAGISCTTTGVCDAHIPGLSGLSA